MKKFKLMINEPWDFQNSKGSNILVGKIINELDSEHVIFQAEEVVSLQGICSDIFILSTRYKEDNISSRSSVTVNGGLVDVAKISGSSEEIKKQAKFVIIGSLMGA